MNAALSFSYQNNLLKKNDYHEFLNHVKGPNLPYNIKKYFSKKDLNKILFYMMRDKKNNTSKINLILLKKIGSPLINKEFNKNKLKSFLKNELSY